eukprot:1906547-Prymnesium_polylepis.1
MVAGGKRGFGCARALIRARLSASSGSLCAGRAFGSGWIVEAVARIGANSNRSTLQAFSIERTSTARRRCVQRQRVLRAWASTRLV